MTQPLFPNSENPNLLPFEMNREPKSIIKVIGVGGGGSNAVNHMYKMGIKGVDFLVCNTDARALEISPVPTKVQLGPGLTQGMGAGAIAEVGKQAVKENLDEIRSMLSDGTRMAFITAGMGGGTGTGAAPIIAELAKEMGILTVGIVTVPFNFEGRKRKLQAEAGIEEMKKNVDALIVICNDRLREMYGNLNLSVAFGHADDVLTIAAKSISEIITNTMHIGIDFADTQTVLKDSGVAIMGSAAAEGDNRAVRAAEMALDSPLLNDNVIEGARYILLNITSGVNEVTMDEVGEINDYIQAQAGQTADIIMGIGNDPSLGEKVGVTIIATGFKTVSELQNARITPSVERIVHKLEDKVEPVAPLASVVAPVNNFESNNQVFASAPVSEEKVEKDFSLEPVLIIRDEMQAESVSPVIDFGATAINEQQEEEKEEQSIFTFELEDVNPIIEPSFPVEAEIDLYEAELPEEVEMDDEPYAPIIMKTLDAPVNNVSAPVQSHEVSPEEDMYRRSRERIMRLKEMNYRMNSPSGINDLEKEPAYKRRNVQFENVQGSADSSVSRFTLVVDESEKKTEIRSNTFLHDRVD